jgi:hypothetical protein
MNQETDSIDGETLPDEATTHAVSDEPETHREDVPITRMQNQLRELAAQRKTPSVGRIVHYMLDAGPNKGHARAAIIARVWDDPDAPGGVATRVNLSVFTDGQNDAIVTSPGVIGGSVWRGSVEYDPDGAPGTWRWPPTV